MGPTEGGQTVKLTGVGFAYMTVNFGSFPITGVDCPSDILCYVSSPPGSGSAIITATVDGVTSPQIPADVYVYLVYPSISLLTPYNGPVTGGVPVTVTGQNFSTVPGGTTFLFGSLAPTGVNCGSSMLCTMTAPVRDASAGFLGVNVTATVDGRTSI